MLARRRDFWLLVPAALLAAAIGSSCLKPSGTINLYDCADDDAGVLGALCNTACNGSCEPYAPVDDWSPTPILLWHGPATAPRPSCPTTVKDDSVVGRDPLPPYYCPLCECDPPSCVLPDGVVGSTSAGCAGPFTAVSAGPDGACNQAAFNPNSIQSVGVTQPSVTTCAAAPAPVPKDVTASYWSTIAVLCYGAGNGDCDDPSNFACVPRAPPGFTQCVQGKTAGRTNVECPPAYPHRHVYYRDIDFQVACSPCACSPPIGSDCEAEVTMYKDSSCASNSMLIDVAVSDVPGPTPCYAVPPNTPLRGLTETWIKNQPGHCDPIQSSPVGALKAVDSTAWEFCCADPDTPDP